MNLVCFVFVVNRRRVTAYIKRINAVSYTHLDVYKRQRIVSDNGSQFKVKEFKNMCFKLGIDHITTTEYRPQGNIAGKYLRNLKSALIAYHANDHTSWDQNLSWIQYAFNSAYHEGHKSTSFELL